VTNDKLGLGGRVAIVTGAGAGLGRTYALELAGRGAKVVVNDLGGAIDGTGSSRSVADKVVNEIKKLGGQAVPSYDNVANLAGGERITEIALEAFGSVDIVVNNAGILRDKSFIKMAPENWDAVVAVHLTGAYNVTRPAFKIMKKKGYGRIVMTTSSAGLHGNFGVSNYSAAKMGLVGLMNVLKLEGAKNNIKVNTIAPMAVSRLAAGQKLPDQFEKLKPEFITPMVIYLCSEQCRESGNIYNAGQGVFSRTQVLNGTPVVVSDGTTPPTTEEIMARLDDINNMENSKFYESMPDFFSDFLGVRRNILYPKEKRI
jgi:NAD(P)-dependent dehydrogenase (short-subunit alcohol dehydrogenase family)